MGRQKQLIVPLEDSVVESLQTWRSGPIQWGKRAARDIANSCLCAQIAAGTPLLARPFSPVEVITYGR